MQRQQIRIGDDHVHSPVQRLRVVGFWVDCRPPWVCAFRALDPPVFLRGYDYRRITVLPTNEYRFVLDCVEERAEALSGSGNRNSLHISN